MEQLLYLWNSAAVSQIHTSEHALSVRVSFCFCFFCGAFWHTRWKPPTPEAIIVEWKAQQIPPFICQSPWPLPHLRLMLRRPFGRVIISEMFWLALAFYADLLAVAVLWQICFAHLMWFPLPPSLLFPSHPKPFLSQMRLKIAPSFISSNLASYLFDFRFCTCF